MIVRRALPLLAIGCALLAILLGRFAPARRLFVESAGEALAAAAVILACIATGHAASHLARKLFRLAADRNLLDLTTTILIGFPLFGTLVALIAWSGAAIHVTVPALTACLAAVGAILLWRQRPSLASPHPLLLPPIALALAMALVPVTSPDELIYKLAVPHAYLLSGEMQELPLSSHSYATLAPHLTDMASLAIASGIAAKLARFALFLAALAALFRLARRFTSRPHWIVAIVAWTPALALTSGWCWDEWGLIGLVALALDRLYAWGESANGYDCAIACAATGAAAATKYTALPFVVAFLAILVLRARTQRRLLLAGALLIALFGGFFYLRNLIWTGSPIAPVLARDAPPILAYRTAEEMGGWRELARGSYIFDAGMIDESLGVLMPLAAIASLFAFRRREFRDLLIIGGLQMPLLLSMSPIAHNLTAGLLPLAIAGGVVLIEIGSAWRVFATLAMLAQAVVIVFVAQSYDLDSYLGGNQTAAQFIGGRFSFARPYQWLNTATPDDARVLLLGETRTFYLERRFLAAGNLDGPRIAGWLARFPSASQLRAELHRLGITHLLLRRSGYRVVSPGAPALSLIEKEQVLEVTPEIDLVIRALLSEAVIRYRDNDFIIAELR